MKCFYEGYRFNRFFFVFFGKSFFQIKYFYSVETERNRVILHMNTTREHIYIYICIIQYNRFRKNSHFCRDGHTGRFLRFRAESKITNLLAQNPKNLLFLFRQPANFNPPSVFFLSQIQSFASTAILPGILIVPLFTI